MLAVVLPLVIIPIFIVGGVIGYISYRQAYLGITQTSKDDLEHMAGFTLDLLNSHHQQFQVYKQDKAQSFNQELATLTNLSYNIVESQNRHYKSGKMDLATAKGEARRALKKVSVGQTGYIYAMTSKGDLTVHIAQEGENVYGEKDENGRYFIREMCQKALRAKPGEVLYIIYPWRNAVLGDKYPRNKVVAYRYFKEWDWIVAAGGYLEETYEDIDFRKAFLRGAEGETQEQEGGADRLHLLHGQQGKLYHPPYRRGEELL